MNRKKMGNLGEAMAIAYYTKQGYTVSVPLGDSARYDLIIDDGSIKRVQVKSTSQFTPRGIPVVSLSTQGGNQSWQGTVKYITAEEVDVVFIYHTDGTMWELPVEVCAGRRGLNLGKKQEQYKVSWE